MSRPKVPEDQRKRTANACQFCKTRKQKCNGKSPCSLCLKKKNAHNCKYDPVPVRKIHAPTKRSSDAVPSPATPDEAHIPTPNSEPSPSGDHRTNPNGDNGCTGCGGSGGSGDVNMLGTAWTEGIAHGTAVARGANSAAPTAPAAPAAPAVSPGRAAHPSDSARHFVSSPASATSSAHAHIVPFASTPSIAATHRSLAVLASVMETGPTLSDGPGTPDYSSSSSSSASPDVGTPDTSQEASSPWATRADQEMEPVPVNQCRQLPSMRTRQSRKKRNIDFIICAEIYSTPRMLGLALPNGRTTNLLGPSSHLACLDALRNFLEVEGTKDPMKRRLDDRTELKEVRPAIEMGITEITQHEEYVLLESFFINTHGLVHVFEERSSLHDTIVHLMEHAVNSKFFVALQSLAIAIGSVMAVPNSEAGKIEIDAEAWFQSVNEKIGDYKEGIELVQAYLLMSVYALTVVRRNAAYEYLGKAGWLAQRLGMAREEDLLMRMEEIMGEKWVFPGMSGGAIRRNTWCSVIVLDRFIAAQLGRPTLVHDENAFPPPPERSVDDAATLHPAMQSSWILSTILRKIYSREDTSLGNAIKITGKDPTWPYMPHDDTDDDVYNATHNINLHLKLEWRPKQGEGSPQGAGAAERPKSFSGPSPRRRKSSMTHFLASAKPVQLSTWTLSGRGSTPAPAAVVQRAAVYNFHNRLLQLHTVVLLGRPFVLYDLGSSGSESSDGRHPGGGSSSLPPLPAEAVPLVRDCVRAAYRSIDLSTRVMEQGYLPQRNPFAIYFLFSAALIVIGQDNPSRRFRDSGDQFLDGTLRGAKMRDVLALFKYFSQSDPQGTHLHELLRYLCTQCRSTELSSLAGETETHGRGTVVLPSRVPSSSPRQTLLPPPPRSDGPQGNVFGEGPPAKAGGSFSRHDDVPGPVIILPPPMSRASSALHQALHQAGPPYAATFNGPLPPAASIIGPLPAASDLMGQLGNTDAKPPHLIDPRRGSTPRFKESRESSPTEGVVPWPSALDGGTGYLPDATTTTGSSIIVHHPRSSETTTPVDNRMVNNSRIEVKLPPSPPPPPPVGLLPPDAMTMAQGRRFSYHPQQQPGLPANTYQQRHPMPALAPVGLMPTQPPPPDPWTAGSLRRMSAPVHGNMAPYGGVFEPGDVEMTYG